MLNTRKWKKNKRTEEQMKRNKEDNEKQRWKDKGRKNNIKEKIENTRKWKEKRIEK